MKRIIKLNLVLFLVLGGALLASIALLVLVIMENMDIEKHFAEAEKLRSEISALNKEKPAPVSGNLKIIEDDTKFIAKETAKLKRNFGDFEKEALKVFVKELKAPADPEDKENKEILNYADFKELFEKEWNADSGRNSVGGLDRFYIRFSRKYPNWNRALRAFCNAYQKNCFEPIDSSNDSMIFLAAMGVPRKLKGDIESAGMNYMLKMRAKAMDTYTAKNEEFRFLGDAADFSFDFSNPPLESDIPAISRTWEHIGDLSKRIAALNFDSLSDFAVRDINGVESGDYKLYHYTFKVNGSMEQIRALLASLNNAYKDQRVYVVRSIFLYVDVDGVQSLLFERKADEERMRQSLIDGDSTTENGVDSRKDVEAIDDSEAISEDKINSDEDDAVKQVMEAISLERRPGYGRILFGGDLKYEAVIDVDYVTLAKPVLE